MLVSLIMASMLTVFDYLRRVRGNIPNNAVPGERESRIFLSVRMFEHDVRKLLLDEQPN